MATAVKQFTPFRTRNTPAQSYWHYFSKHKGAAISISGANTSAVAYLLPPNSVCVFYPLFPDPWPKRRHQRRRIVTEEFIEAIHRALVTDGLFVIATDEREYFEEIRRKSEQMRKFAEKSIGDLVLPPTTFEKHFLQRGLEIHRLGLRKISPVK